MYVLGGYGPNATAAKGYITYSHIAKLNVKSLIKVIKKEALSNEEWKGLMRANFKTPSTTGTKFLTIYSATFALLLPRQKVR